jgi:hypothetical protein
MTIPLPRNSVPRPKTTEAVLFCEKERNFTPHTFTEAKEILNEDTHHRQATKFIYTCKCGQPRVWGSED